MAEPLYFSETGHYYELIEDRWDWLDAKAAAETSSFVGVNGHLATITSASEQSFITSNFSLSYWCYWLGGFQPDGSLEPNKNWQWVTGEAWNYTNWDINQPDDDFGEDCLGIYGAPLGSQYKWNDVTGKGERTDGTDYRYTLPYLVEYEPLSTPAPQTLPGTISAIKADDVHRSGVTGSGVKIGLVDSGGKPWSAHPALNGSGKVQNGESDVNLASVHATKAAGIVVGEHNGANVLGTGRDYVGVAPGSTLEASVATHQDEIDNRVSELKDSGCDVIGVICKTSADNLFVSEINRTIDDIVNSNKVTVIATAGNSSEDSDIVCPGNAYNVITVGTLRNTGPFENGIPQGPWDKAGSENISGPTASYYGPSRCKPDVVAPGECIVADHSDDSYGSSNGAYSSYATPHVIGAAALMVEAARDANAYFVDGDIVDPRVIKSAILTGADKGVKRFDGGNWDASSSSQPLDYELGAGGLDVEEAIKVMLGEDDDTTSRHMAFDVISWTEQTVELSLGHLAEDSEITASLVWNAHLVLTGLSYGMDMSDLDLYLLKDDTPFMWSTSSVDNIEHIYATGLEEGDYSLQVRFIDNGWDPLVSFDSEQFALSYSAVPEPATLSLLLICGSGLFCRRRRQ